MYFLIIFTILSFLILWLFFHFNFHKRNLSPEDAVEIVEQFLRSEGGAYDMDDFISIPIKDPEVDAFRLQCCKIDFITEEGRAQLRNILEEYKKARIERGTKKP